MLNRSSFLASLVLLAMLFGLALLTPALTAQSDKAPAAADKKPVADASIYLRFPDQKKVELDLKTNQEGIARSPEIRQGKVLIQVVAQGWKTYGEYHDVTESEQTIQIHLVKPPIRWY